MICKVQFWMFSKDLTAFLKDQNEHMEQATQYLGAAEEARKGEINQAYLEVLAEPQ